MRLLKINSLPNTKEYLWIDRDVIMLHACFQLLVDCIEKESLLTHCDYTTYKKEIDEANFLYDWWNIRKDDEDNDGGEDDEMLIRLMHIRKFLWT